MRTIIEKSKGTVRFAFKDSIVKLKGDKNKDSLIMLHFSYGKKRFKYSTGYKSSYNDWDFKRQRIKNKIAIVNRDEINAHLSRLEQFLKKDYSLLDRLGETITNDLLKHKLDVFTNRVSPVDDYIDILSFFCVIDKFISEKKDQISIITIRSYKQTKKRLEEYENGNNSKLSFDLINMQFYKDFNQFLELKGYSLNTIGKHIKSLKTFLNYALNEGYTDNQRFKRKDFKVKKELTTEIYLNQDEIRLMHEADLSKYPKLEHARDIFLLGCYTGQRISDYNNLKETDIVTINGVNYFKFKQKKNRKYSKEVLCPITKEIKQIMDLRYNGNPPIKINEQDLNENIKQVGQMLGFDGLIKVEYTKGGERKLEMVPKYKLIKSHTARRSFCTNKYKAGMNVFDIMLFSGHTTEKEFIKYIRIRDEERASHIVKNGFFNV